MSEFRKGDLVEATNGEMKAVGRLTHPETNDPKYGKRLFIEGFGHIPYVDAQNSPWSFRIIERGPEPEPEVALPTEPGLYSDSEGGLWRFDGVLWRLVGSTGGAILPRHIVAPCLPFVRLRTEAETARAVLTAIDERYCENFLNNPNDAWNDVARQFGVAS